jgi:hypothetical protein
VPSEIDPVIIESVAEPNRMDAAGPTEPVTEPEIEPAIP